MSQVPYDPSVRVAPQAAPTPLQNLEAPLEAFGANVLGAAAKQYGESTGAVSDQLSTYAERAQAVTNKIASDNGAFNQFVPQAASAWEKFKLGNQGVDPDGQVRAVKNLPDFYKSIEDLRAEIGGPMSPLAKIDYDTITRRYVGGISEQAANFAAGEGHKAAISTSEAKLETLQASGAANVYGGDPDALDASIKGIAAETAFQSRELGLSPEAGTNLLHKNIGGIFFSGVRQAVAAGDGPAANAIFDAHKGDMTLEQIDGAASALKTFNVANNTQANANALFNGGTVNGPADIKSAILGQESGGNPNVGNSSAGAVGIGQIEPKTFAQFAKSGESIHDPAANRAVSARIIDHYEAQYNGDPARVAVAYFSGPGNVAAVGSPTPWKRDAVDSDGTHTSTYVHGVLGRMGGGGAPVTTTTPVVAITPSSDPEQVLATGRAAIDARVQAAFPSNYQQQDATRSAMERILTDRVDILKANQGATYDRIDQWIQEHPNADPAEVQKTFANDWASLPPKYVAGLERATMYNGNLQTDARENNYTALMGLAGDPSKRDQFTSTDMRNVDLTFGQRRQLQTLQSSLGRAPQSQKPDGTVEAIAKSPQGDQALRALGIAAVDPKSHQRPNAYYWFRGALQEEVDTYRSAHNGAAPTTQKDVGDLIARVTAATSQRFHYEIPGLGIAIPGTEGTEAGPPVFAVPKGDRDAIISAYGQVNGGAVPTEEEIGRRFAVRQRARGTLR